MRKFGLVLLLAAASLRADTFFDLPVTFNPTAPATFFAPVTFNLGSAPINMNNGLLNLYGTWDFTNATVIGISAGGTCITCSGTDGQVAIWNAAGNKFIAGDPIVSGPDAVGVAPTKNPVLTGGLGADAHVHTISTDNSGDVNVNVLNSPTISGTVSVSNFPATQPVSGTVTANQGGTWTVQPGNTANTTAWKVDGSAVTQPVSGTVTANAGTGTFTVGGTVTANAGTNLNTSALALDATVAKLNLGQASTTSGQTGPLIQGAVTTSAPTYTTAQTDPLSLNTSGGLRVDGSGVTQPISGTVTANAGTGTFTVSGTVTANAGTNLNTSALALESGGNLATIASNLNLGQGSTTSGQKANLILGAVTTAAPTYTTAQSDPLSLNTAGGLRVDGSGVTQPVSGTVTANAGTGTFNIQSNASVNVAQIAGNSTTTVANGVQEVGIVGGASGARVMDTAISGGSTAFNALVAGGIYNNATPIAPTDGNGAALQIDQSGNLRTFNGIALKTLAAQGTALNSAQTIFSNSGAPAVLVQLTQTTTLTAGAITFEVSYDGTNWFSMPTNTVLDPTANNYPVIALPYTVQASTNKPFLLMCGGAQALRIRTSTAITGTGVVTPNYALLNYTPITQFSSANATISTNLLQVGSNSVATAGLGSGVQKVGIVGSSNVALDSATGAAVPANGLLLSARAATANPSNATGGNLVGAMADKAGRLVTTPYQVRDLVGVQQTAISASASETTIVTAGAAGVFNDISQLVITNSGSATCSWTLKDSTAGTTRGIYDMPATVGTSLVISFNPPLPQATAANNWTITCSTATSTGAHIQVVFIKNT